MINAIKIPAFHLINGQYNSSKVNNKYSLPKYNMYTNFLLKHMSIVNRALYINSLIDKLFDTWLYLINAPEPPADINTNPVALYKFTILHNQWQEKHIVSFFEQEEFITQLRKITDECISLYSIENNIFKSNGKPYEGIDELLRKYKEKDNILFQDLLPYKDYFKRLNNISNGFKHCAANDISRLIGKDEPCVFIYYNNNKTKTVDLAGIEVNKIVSMFNDFYNYFNSIITK